MIPIHSTTVLYDKIAKKIHHTYPNKFTKNEAKLFEQ